MKKQRKYSYINVSFLCCLLFLLFATMRSTAQYQLRINYIGKDTSFNPQDLKLQTNFNNGAKCRDYIAKIPAQLYQKGYAAASVDSVHFDSTFATIQLYLGKQQRWVQLRTDSIDKQALAMSGFANRNFIDKPVDFVQLETIKKRILSYYENNGYPFASVYLDSISILDNSMNAILKASSGPLYYMDSIRVFGKVKIANSFLQRHLGITNGSIYSKEKLQQVSKRMANLEFVTEQQPSDVTLLGDGAVLNLYLTPRKSSQFNFLIGVQPSNTQTGKLQVTGDVNLNLKNAFAHGESVLLNWQQLQPSSPRLNVGYQQPYLFKSPFGIDFLFDLFKKDSNFLQINALIGTQYVLSDRQTGGLYYQHQSNTLLEAGVDTNQVIATKQLPPNADVSSSNIGLEYGWNSTNYKFNPRKGNEIKIFAATGIRKIKRNNDIINITDPSFDYESLYDSIELRTYQIRIKASAAHYFPLGKQTTLKVGINGGLFNSPDIFRNELFQIGGYKLLRGFDEESIYATQYGVGTTEFRYLFGLNSYLFYFIDIASVKTKYQGVDTNTGFFGTGLGLVFETKLGLLNISYAIGKRNDVALDLRQSSKIHFGYINYF